MSLDSKVLLEESRLDTQGTAAPKGRRLLDVQGIDVGEPLDPSSPVPLYAQLVAWSSAYIARLGEKGVGCLFPSENECVSLFKVSRPTVRQAISELEAQGLLRKERGKGVFICEPRIVHDISHVFEDDMQAARRKVEFILCEHGFVAPSPSLLKTFGDDTKRLYRVQRRRAIAGRVLGVEERFFPERFAKFLTPKVLMERDVFAILQLCISPEEITSDNVVSAIKLDRKEAELVGVAAGAMALTRSTTSFVGTTPVMFGVVTFLADRYQLRFHSTVDLRRRKPKAAENA
jgi:GntR family transcriptional regulator